MNATNLRILMGLFLIMTFGVALNLMVLQPKRNANRLASLVTHPSNPPSGADQQDGVKERQKPTGALAQWDIVRRELRRNGYLSATNNGPVDATARAAVLAFEYDHGLPLTARAGDDLIEALIMGVPRAPGTSLKPASDEARQLIQSVQTSLTTLGYPAGPIDGAYGNKTQAAILAFERREGLPETGRISAVLLDRLVRAVSRRRAG